MLRSLSTDTITHTTNQTDKETTFHTTLLEWCRDQDIHMTEYQDNDDHCLNIKTQLNKGGNEKISSEYVIQDNILYHLGKENRFETDPFLQLVIPLKLVNTVL